MSLKPSKGDLHHWRQDKITRWIMEQLQSQYKPWPSDLPAKDLIEFNTKVGQQQVLKTIDRLCDTE